MDTERKEHFDDKPPQDETFGAIEAFYRKNFNTELEPDQEWRFHDWAETRSKAAGRDILDDLTDYDLRGAFKDGSAFDERGHMPDKFKKPNHPTFSVESVYHGTPDLQRGGSYEGGEWGRLEDGRDTFKPSQKMLDTTHPATWLKGYMNDREPDAVLLMPETKKPAEAGQ